MTVQMELTLEEDGKYKNIVFRKARADKSITHGRKLDFKKIKIFELRKETKKRAKT